MAYLRPLVETIKSRILETAPRIQVILGPRQVGKTTAMRQLMGQVSIPVHYVNADDIHTPGREWLIAQWNEAIAKGPSSLLIVDEIQKVPNWPETLKARWDHGSELKVIVLGSSSLSLQQGLTESLAGRYEVIDFPFWSFSEMRDAFDYTLDQYLVYGGYPGAVQYDKDYPRWFQYLKSSIVESVIGQDILSIRRVGNPALFKQAFEILCNYPGQEISYNKLLGQLQEKGNVDLIKTYIDLYSAAFLIRSLQKFSNKAYLRKSSSPKLLPGCPALFTLYHGPNIQKNNDIRGHLFEMMVGQSLFKATSDVYYWREGNQEIDFVVQLMGKVIAIEVKSGRIKSLTGLSAFCKQNPAAIPVIISSENIDEFDANPYAFLCKRMGA